MTRTLLQQLRTVQQGRSANIASSTNATPIVVTRTGAATINVSAASGTPILITCAAAHGLFDGDMVTIASVGGNTNANGNFFVLVVNSTQFQIFTAGYVPVASNAAYISGGTVQPWLFQDGDLVVVAGHATNTNANGTWIASSDSATLTTLLGQYDLTNSVGNGIGAATGTQASAGSAVSSVAGLDISALTVAQGGTTVGEPTVRVRVKVLNGGNATFTLEDSVNAFTAWRRIAAVQVNGGGGITPRADYSIVWPFREIARTRFGTASALLRLRCDADAGAICTYDSWLEY